MHRDTSADPVISVLQLLARQMEELNDKMQVTIDMLQASIDSVVSLGAEIAYDREHS